MAFSNWSVFQTHQSGDVLLARGLWTYWNNSRKVLIGNLDSWRRISGTSKQSKISTKAPTVQRTSEQLELEIEASTSGFALFWREVLRAYLKSAKTLTSDSYIRAPPELGLPEATVLKIIKPLYGIPEAGLWWYLTHVEHHRRILRMTKSNFDPCMLIRKETYGCQVLVILLVDDSFAFGDRTFINDEEVESKAFLVKPRKFRQNKQWSLND